MIVLPCQAPHGHLDPAPVTSMPLTAIVGQSQVDAFWATDDGYYLRASSSTGEGRSDDRWFRVESDGEGTKPDCGQQLAAARLMENIIPIGAGRIAFPFGSSGRRVYRVWRTGSQENGGRTKIREVRAVRSRRLPA